MSKQQTGSKQLLAGMAVVGLLGLAASSATAAPIVNLTVLGNTDGSANYSSTVTASPGATVYFKVVAELAPIGTTNTQLGTAVTSETGINAVRFNILGPVSGVVGTFGTKALDAAWAAGTGANAGSVVGNDVTNIFAAQSAGVYVGVNGSPSTVLTGQFSVSAVTTEGLLSLSKYSTMGGSFKVNGGVKFISNVTESNADPYVGYTGLTLAVPEPTSMGLLGLGSLALLHRRHKSC